VPKRSKRARRRRVKTQTVDVIVGGQAIADQGPPERANHQGGLAMEARIVTKGGLVVLEGARVMGESQVDILADQGVLGDGDERRLRLAAAHKFRGIYAAAGLRPLVTARYDERMPQGFDDSDVDVPTAFDQLTTIERGVGRAVFTVVENAVGLELPLNALGRKALPLALDALVRHWRLNLMRRPSST
jgi:hypothetical protein